jgi:hypothetical protein
VHVNDDANLGHVAQRTTREGRQRWTPGRG